MQEKSSYFSASAPVDVFALSRISRGVPPSLLTSTAADSYFLTYHECNLSGSSDPATSTAVADLCFIADESDKPDNFPSEESNTSAWHSERPPSKLVWPASAAEEQDVEGNTSGALDGSRAAKQLVQLPELQTSSMDQLKGKKQNDCKAAGATNIPATTTAPSEVSSGSDFNSCRSSSSESENDNGLIDHGSQVNIESVQNVTPAHKPATASKSMAGTEYASKNLKVNGGEKSDVSRKHNTSPDMNSSDLSSSRKGSAASPKVLMSQLLGEEAVVCDLNNQSHAPQQSPYVSKNLSTRLPSPFRNPQGQPVVLTVGALAEVLDSSDSEKPEGRDGSSKKPLQNHSPLRKI